MPLDRTHQHISTSIMRDGAPQTPINPDGGGGLANPLTEDLDAGGFTVKNLLDPTDPQDAMTLAYADDNYSGNSLYNILSNGNEAGDLQIKGLANPTDPQDAATKAYVDANAALLSATIDLDAADIATLNTVPVEVVAAPGADKAIIVVAASFQFAPGAVAFDDTQTLSLLVEGSTSLADTALVPFDNLAGAVIATFAQQLGAVLTATADAPLVLMANAGDPDGAGDGTARLTVLYYVMDLLV